MAAALYAAGKPILSRSMRYHRARGLFCATGACTHCFLRIDGQPNQRSCQAPCEPTTWSEGQNAFPNVGFDLLEAADLAYPNYLDAHRAFVRPRFLRPLFTRVIRGMAGFGRVPRTPVAQAYLRVRDDPEVLVVGGGPAGLAAAQAAAEAGARVTLIETEKRLGGRLRHLPTPFQGLPDAPQAEGKAFAADSERHLRALGATIRAGARAFGVYDGVWAAATSTTLFELLPGRVVVATGAQDTFEAFPGSDRAGVLQATAAERLLNQHGIPPADPVAILGATRHGLLLARDLRACGVRVAGVFDARAVVPPSPVLDEVRAAGLRVEAGWRPRFVAGRCGPRAIVFLTPQGRVRVPCRSVVTATNRAALGQLFQQAGARLVFEPLTGGWIPQVNSQLETSREAVFAAGSCAGAADPWESVQMGRRAGAAAARKAPVPPPDARTNGHGDGLDRFRQPVEGIRFEKREPS